MLLQIVLSLLTTSSLCVAIVIPPSDGINRVNNRPSYDELTGEPLFHIQEGGNPFGSMPQSPILIPGLGQDIVDIPDDHPDDRGPVLLRTQLAVTPDVGIFATYVRDVESLEQRFNDEEKYSIVLAPSDAAVRSLAKKPWAFPTPVDEKLPESEKEQIIRNNVRTFIAEHVHFGNLDAVLALGNTIVSQTLKMETGRIVVLNKFGELCSVEDEEGNLLATITSASRVKNGVIFVLDSTLVKPL
jgi:hypothetical protein